MLSRLTSSITVLALVAMAGCDKGSTNPPGAGGGGQGTTSGETGGAHSTGGGGQAQGGGGEGGSVPIEVNPEDFEGIDVAMVASAKPPSGCVGGFDISSGALTLTLDTEVPAVLIGAVNGEIQANGVTCFAADGAKATVSTTKAITIVGSAADEAVILDLATGPLPSGIHVDMGGGEDAFFLRGSYKGDKVTLGTDAGAPAIDLDDDGKPDAFVSGAEVLTVSLGPGNDACRASGIGSSAPLAMAVTLFGGADNDTLEGGAGNDTLHGGVGDDVFETASTADGSDVYDGGEGFDTVDYGHRAAALVVSMADQANDGEPGEHDDVTLTIEGLKGGSGDDVLTGGPGDDTIFGGVGSDLIRGGAGSDTLRGEDGDDTLMGEEGDDYLYGDLGDDVIQGNVGDDILDGGEGHNTLDAGDGDGDICIAPPTDSMVACELY